jgi:exonuclease 3'-5' domain-containing protein 2
VCTDVEGSTAMWEWNSAVMQDAIFIHDEIIRRLIAEHCGVEVMTEGDAFIIAFHDPHDALLYCLHIQASPSFLKRTRSCASSSACLPTMLKSASSDEF